VTPKQVIEVDRLAVSEGDTVELEKVLFINEGEDMTLGNPTIEGAKVVTTCLGEIKGNKIIVFKYKPKARYRKKTGHRQIYTKLIVNDIVKSGR